MDYKYSIYAGLVSVERSSVFPQEWNMAKTKKKVKTKKKQVRRYNYEEYFQEFCVPRQKQGQEKNENYQRGVKLAMDALQKFEHLSHQ